MAKRKLPAKLNAGQVAARIDTLFNSRPMIAYHAAIPTYRALTLMRLEPDLPESFDHGISVALPSTRVIEVVGALLGKAAGFVRYTDMVAKAERSGVPSQKLVDKADRGGRTLTVMNAALDTAKRKTRAMQARQLVDGWCVLQLHRRKRPGNGFGWEVEVCDAISCAFPEEEGGAFIPKRLARRFTMLMSAVKDMYDGRGDLERGHDGAFAWRPLSAPRATDEGEAFVTTPGNQGDASDIEVELCIYDDGCYIYHLVRNPSQAGSSNNTGAHPQLLYCERNTCHQPGEGEEYETDAGAAAVVVPGDTFAFGADGEKMLPVLFAVQNNVNNLNLLRAIRGRSALKDTPDMAAAINATPEEFEQLKQMGAVKPVDDDGAAGGSVVYITGKDVTLTPWQLRTNQDLDSLDQAIREDVQVSVSELLVQTNPDVIAAATATAYHTATGETGQRHSGWLGNGDFAWAAIDQMICNDVVNSDDEYDFVASEAQPRSGSKEVAKGEYLSLSPADLDFRYDITVVTKQETEDQKNKRLLNALFLKNQGIRTLIGVIAEDTVDVTARLQELFEDQVRIVAQPVLLTQFLPSVLEQYIKTGAGVFIPLSRPENAAMFMPANQPPAPSTQPTQTFAPAPQEPVTGGGSAPGAMP